MLARTPPKPFVNRARPERIQIALRFLRAHRVRFSDKRVFESLIKSGALDSLGPREVHAGFGG